MIVEYWYSKQLRSYIRQFCGIFTGLSVVTGIGESGEPSVYQVPIVVGSRDRVVAALMSGNTQNKPFSIPMMSATLSGLDLAPERRKGVGVVDRKVYLPSGGVFPDDLRVNKRVMPIPYNANMELAFYASNTEQMHQMIEQILILFDPVLQLQTSEAPFDWTKITSVELTGINNEENYPIGTERRIIVWSFNFVVQIYLSAPMDIRDDIIREINIRLGNMNGMALNEVDADGELQPFQEVYGPLITVQYEEP
jgi:hypothetical protein